MPTGPPVFLRGCMQVVRKMPVFSRSNQSARSTFTSMAKKHSAKEYTISILVRTTRPATTKHLARHDLPSEHSDAKHLVISNIKFINYLP